MPETPEQKARREIDQNLTASGWIVQSRDDLDLTAGRGIAVSDFDEFVECYRPGAIHRRKPTWSEGNPDGRWRSYEYEDLLKRDKLSLDLFWVKDKSLTDTDSLPAPDVLAAEIVDDLEAALAQFSKIAAKLKSSDIGK
jgi:type I restriction enzyme M protein